MDREESAPVRRVLTILGICIAVLAAWALWLFVAADFIVKRLGLDDPWDEALGFWIPFLVIFGTWLRGALKEEDEGRRPLRKVLRHLGLRRWRRGEWVAVPALELLLYPVDVFTGDWHGEPVILVHWERARPKSGMGETCGLVLIIGFRPTRVAAGWSHEISDTALRKWLDAAAAGSTAIPEGATRRYLRRNEVFGTRIQDSPPRGVGA